MAVEVKGNFLILGFHSIKVSEIKTVTPEVLARFIGNRQELVDNPKIIISTSSETIKQSYTTLQAMNEDLELIQAIIYSLPENESMKINIETSGNNNQINTGIGHNIHQQNISAKYDLKGNISELIRLFRDKGISQQDLEELALAIEQDEPNHEIKEFGPQVKAWITMMISKAMDMSWNIGLGAAGSLLAESLNTYYGWIS